MRILLTSGTGYIGNHVPVLLSQTRRQIVVFDNLSNSNNDISVKLTRIARQDTFDVRGYH